MKEITNLANRFLDNKELAIVGVSRNKNKFGYKVFDLLKSNGYKIYPFHYQVKEIDGIPCVQSFNDIPDTVKNLYVATPKYVTNEVIASLNRKFEMVWFQQKSDTIESVEMVKTKGSKVITNRCMFMFVNPKGGHEFHRKFMKFFGKI